MAQQQQQQSSAKMEMPADLPLIRFADANKDASMLDANDLGKKRRISDNATITLSVETTNHFANSLINLTQHTVNVLPRQPADSTASIADMLKQPMVVIPASGQTLLLKSTKQECIRTMPAHVDGGEEASEMYTVVNAADGEHEIQGPPQTRRKIVTVDVYEPQRFRGFVEPLPKISRSTCSGVIVGMPVGEYLERINADDTLDRIVPLSTTNSDSIDTEPVLRVPVYGPDSGPTASLRDRGQIAGTIRLVRYDAVY